MLSLRFLSQTRPRSTRLFEHSYRTAVSLPLLSHRTYQTEAATCRTEKASESKSPAMDAQEFRKSAQAAVDQITTYFDNLANSKLPVLPNIQPGYLAPRLPKSAPEEPESWLENIPADIEKHIIPGVTHWQHPNFHAFFPACTTYPSILAEMYSSAFTGPAFNWLCSPACTELETVVLDWMCKALALPECFLSTGSTGGGGVIQGSASEAIVTCMVAARERTARNICRKEGLQEGSEEWDDRVAELRGKLVALSSDQAHSSTAKGARIAGTRYRSVPTKWEDDLTLKVATLKTQLEECVRKGWIPYYITLTLGTTSTCAVDPFQEITAMLKSKYPEVWIHVDAAYAGTALICEELRTKAYNPWLAMPALRTITNGHDEAVNGSGASSNTGVSDTRTLDADFGQVDSFNTNMHKWLLTSFDASLLYVRDRNDLISAMSISPTYLQNKHTDSGLVTDYRDWQIPLGRRFRALKIWFVIRTYGMQGMRAHIRKGVRLGELTEDLVLHSEAGKGLFELVSPTTYGLCCFRIRPEAIPAAMAAKRKAGSQSDSSMNGAPTATVKQQSQTVEETIANELTKKVADLVNDSGKAFLTSSATDGKTFIRIVSGNENANEDSVKAVFNLCVEFSKQLLVEV